jgi:hypothetical protein
MKNERICVEDSCCEVLQQLSFKAFIPHLVVLDYHTADNSSVAAFVELEILVLEVGSLCNFSYRFNKLQISEQDLRTMLNPSLFILRVNLYA